jgi:hypothetical protein
MLLRMKRYYQFDRKYGSMIVFRHRRPGG